MGLKALGDLERALLVSGPHHDLSLYTSTDLKIKKGY